MRLFSGLKTQRGVPLVELIECKLAHFCRSRHGVAPNNDKRLFSVRPSWNPLSLRQSSDGWSRYTAMNERLNIRRLRIWPTDRLTGRGTRRDRAPQPARLPLEHTPQGSTAQ